MEQSFIINHLGENREDYFNAVSPPIIQSSNFAFENVEKMRSSIANELDVSFYTRGNNPTVQILRKKIAALEGMEEALVFSSGMGAISAAVLSCLSAGDHAICINNSYGWTKKLLSQFLSRFGVQCTYVDGKELSAFKDAIKSNTRLIILESPNSLLLELQDIEAVCNLANESGIRTILDNSYASPIGQNASALGVDIVVHTASKYIGGHSDLVAGVLCCSRKRIEKIFESEFMTLGGIVSPNDAWLMLRSLRTLPIRMKRISESTMEVVSYLENHSLVQKVIYPFSKSHNQYDLARKQMEYCGGLFSIIMKTTDVKTIEKFVNALKYFSIACSWGGHESLVLPVCGLGDPGVARTDGLPINLIRFYIGLEDPSFLLKDLDQALSLD